MEPHDRGELLGRGADRAAEPLLERVLPCAELLRERGDAQRAVSVCDGLHVAAAMRSAPSGDTSREQELFEGRDGSTASRAVAIRSPSRATSAQAAAMRCPAGSPLIFYFRYRKLYPYSERRSHGHPDLYVERALPGSQGSSRVTFARLR